MINQAARSVWNSNDLKNPHQLGDKNRRVRKMFSGLAGSYDLANHVLSFNFDRYWRRKAIDWLDIQPGQKVLDLCCGTGDLLIQIAKNHVGLSQLVGLDFAEPMLTLANQKYLRLLRSSNSGRHNTLSAGWLCADAEMTCLPDCSFDRICCAFGLRNTQKPENFLREIYRLIKPSGRAVVVEFAMPKNPVIRWAYQCYFRLVLPLIGSMIALDRNRSYHYLAESVKSFSSEKELRHLFDKVGFDRVTSRPMTGGIVIAYIAEKK